MSTAGEGRFGCIPAIGSECDPAMQMLVEAVNQYLMLRAVPHDSCEYSSN